jgi:hypothetical protein
MSASQSTAQMAKDRLRVLAVAPSLARIMSATVRLGEP